LIESITSSSPAIVATLERKLREFTRPAPPWSGVDTP
jgi:hypothetical protein